MNLKCPLKYILMQIYAKVFKSWEDYGGLKQNVNKTIIKSYDNKKNLKMNTYYIIKFTK